METLADELVSLIVNGADRYRCAFLDPRWRLMAKHVNRRWYNCVTHPSLTDAERMRIEDGRCDHGRWTRGCLAPLSLVVERATSGMPLSEVAIPWSTLVPEGTERAQAIVLVMVGDEHDAFGQFNNLVERLCKQGLGGHWFGEPSVCRGGVKSASEARRTWHEIDPEKAARADVRCNLVRAACRANRAGLVDRLLECCATLSHGDIDRWLVEATMRDHVAVVDVLLQHAAHLRLVDASMWGTDVLRGHHVADTVMRVAVRHNALNVLKHVMIDMRAQNVSASSAVWGAETHRGVRHFAGHAEIEWSVWAAAYGSTAVLDHLYGSTALAIKSPALIAGVAMLHGQTAVLDWMLAHLWNGALPNYVALCIVDHVGQVGRLTESLPTPHLLNRGLDWIVGTVSGPLTLTALQVSMIAARALDAGQIDLALCVAERWPRGLLKVGLFVNCIERWIYSHNNVFQGWDRLVHVVRTLDRIGNGAALAGDDSWSGRLDFWEMACSRCARVTRYQNGGTLDIEPVHAASCAVALVCLARACGIVGTAVDHDAAQGEQQTDAPVVSRRDSAIWLRWCTVRPIVVWSVGLGDVTAPTDQQHAQARRALAVLDAAGLVIDGKSA